MSMGGGSWATPKVNRTFTAPEDVLEIPGTTAEEGFIMVQIIGAFTGALQCEDSLDGGVTYSGSRAFDLATGVRALDMTAPGLYRVDIGGVRHMGNRPRIRAVALTAGAPVVHAYGVKLFF